MKDTPATDHPSRPVLLQSTVGICGSIRAVSPLSLYLPYPWPWRKYPLRGGRGKLIVTPAWCQVFHYHFTPSLHLVATALALPPCLCVSLPSYSQCLTPCLSRTFISETALLIKELIFSLLSAISIVNLKHCEFFKFPLFFYQKQRGRKMGMGGYLIG